MALKVRFLDFSGEGVLRQQWGRFKRREESMLVVIGLAVILHIIFWITWHFGVAPYPTAFSVPLPFSLGIFNFLHSYIWPLVNSAILAVNIGLIYFIYRKDIFASWLLIGANLFLQVLVLAITIYLISFVGPV